MADKILRKLSVKTVTGMTPKALREWADKTPNKPIMTIMGVATATISGETDNGPWTALRGNFIGVNAEGVRFRGGRAFIPDSGALDMVLGTLADDSIDNVKFAFNVFVKEDETSATGYTYNSEPLLEPAENDPLEGMLKNIETKGIAGAGHKAVEHKPAENKAAETKPETAAKK